MTSPKPHLRHIKAPNVKDHSEFQPKQPSPIPRLRHVKVVVKDQPQYSPREPSPIPRLHHVELNIKEPLQLSATNSYASGTDREPSPIPRGRDRLRHVAINVRPNLEEMRRSRSKSPVPRLRHVNREKDASGLTAKQRHDIILKTLTDFNKKADTFKGYWTPDSGEYLTGEILLKTPMFWFMKYKWSRSEIETLFYKARVVIDRKFDSALQETFGGHPGARWKGKRDKSGDDGNGANKAKHKWKRNRHRFQTDTMLRHTSRDYSKWVPPSGDKVFEIKAECPNGDYLTLKVESRDPLHYVKKQIAHKTGGKYSEKEQELWYKNVKMTNSLQTLKKYMITAADATNTILTLSMRQITIFIEYKYNNQQTEIVMDRYQSLKGLKHAMETKLYPHIPTNAQRVYSNSDRSVTYPSEDDEKSLTELQIHDGDILCLEAPTQWREPRNDSNNYVIYIECPDGNTVEMCAVSQDIISYIKLGIETLTKGAYTVKEQRLFFKQYELRNIEHQSLRDIGIYNNDRLQLSTGVISVSVETYSDDDALVLTDIEPHESVLNVKRRIEEKRNIMIADQQLQFNNVSLSDNDKSLFDYRVVNGSVLCLSGDIVIKIRGDNGLTDAFDVNIKTDNVRDIKEKISQKHDAMEVAQQVLYLKDSALADTDTLRGLRLRTNDIIHLKVMYSVRVQYMNEEICALRVFDDDKISSIKHKIEAIPFKDQILKYQNQILDNNGTVKQYKINHNGTLVLSKRLIVKKQPLNRKKDCRLYVDLPNRVIVKLSVNLQDTLADIKQQIESETNGKYSASQLLLEYKEDMMSDDAATLASYGVTNKETLDLSMGYVVVYVEKNDATKWEFNIDAYAPIESLKLEIEKHLYPRIPLREQHLYKTKERKAMDDNEYLNENDELLFDCGVFDCDIIYLGAPQQWRVPMNNDKYNISVQCPDGDELSLFVVPHDIISYVKLQIETVTDEKYRVDEQILYFKGNIVSNDNETLQSIGIQSCALLQVSKGNVKILIETRESKVITLMVSPYEMVLNVKNRIQIETGGLYPASDQQLFKDKSHNEELTDDNKSLFACDVFADSRLYLGGPITIQIKANNGLFIKDLKVDPKWKVEKVKQIICDKYEIAVAQQTVYFKGYTLSDHQTLMTYQIKRNDILIVKLIYRVFINGAKSQTPLDVSPDDTISNVKESIAHKVTPSVPIQHQILKFNDQILENERTIKEYDIIHNSVITFTARPPLLKKAKTMSTVEAAKSMPLMDEETQPKTKKKRRKKKKKEKHKRKKERHKKKKKKKVKSDKTKTPQRDSWKFPPAGLNSMKHKRSLSLQRIVATKQSNPMGVDVDSLFDMAEIDDIVNNLDKYEEKLHTQDVDELDDFDEYNEYEAFRSDELSSESLDDLAEVEKDRASIRASALGVQRISVQPNANPNRLGTADQVKPGPKRMSAIMREIETDALVDVEEKTAFDHRRQMDFDDLMDGFFTDEDEDEDDELVIVNPEPQTQLQIKEESTPLKPFLSMFHLGRNKHLYAYFHDTLGIESAQDLVNHPPAVITQPLQFRSTKVRMLLTKMSKYVMNKVMQNEWNGSKATQWLELEANKMSRVFSPPPTTPAIVSLPSDIVHSSEVHFENEDGDLSNRIQIKGVVVSVVDKKILLEESCALKVHVEQLPDLDKKSKWDNIQIGCNFYDGYGNKYESVYITDRCLIYRGDVYLSTLSMSNPRYIESNSDIHITIDNNKEEPVVKFEHFRNGRMYKYNEKEIVLDSLEQPINSYAKIFIDQSYGKGIYSVYEILRIDNLMNSKTPISNNDTDAGTQRVASIMQRRISF